MNRLTPWDELGVTLYVGTSIFGSPSIYHAYFYKDSKTGEGVCPVQLYGNSLVSLKKSLKKNLKFDTGLLSPKGKPYYCSLGHHDTLARYLGKQYCDDLLFNASPSWIHFTDGDWSSFKPKAITQKQIDFIIDFLEKHDIKKYPDWWGEAENIKV